MAGESVPQNEKRDFYDTFFDRDAAELRTGDKTLKVGTFVTIKKEGFDPEMLYFVTQLLPEEKYKIVSEVGGLGMIFSKDQLVKFDIDTQTFAFKKKTGTV